MLARRIVELLDVAEHVCFCVIARAVGLTPDPLDFSVEKNLSIVALSQTSTDGLTESATPTS